MTFGNRHHSAGGSPARPVGSVLVAIALAFGAGCFSASRTSAALKGTPRPNIVYILTDDLDTEMPGGNWLDHFPRLRALLADTGTTFSNSFVSNSLCCPSRVSILRGQYSHNTQIFTNEGAGGGFQKAHDLGLENSTLATWLHDVGYRTALLGKYLNGYPGNLDGRYVPPGWDEWYGSESNQYLQFFYQLNENGKVVDYGRSPDDYLQDVIRRKATDFIRRAATASPRVPFFEYVSTISPHITGDTHNAVAAVAPRHADAFPDAHAPRPPTFNETDVSHHPQWVQDRPPLKISEVADIDKHYRSRLQSMLAVEDTVEDIVATLRATGQLDSTYIFFGSDNGFHLGQHRLAAGKSTEFDEDIRVPLMVRGPGVPARTVLPHLTVNVDMAPTFADLAGVAIPAFVDGRSLMPLLRIHPPPVSSWRQGFLLEHGFARTGDEGRTPVQSADHLEPPDTFDMSPNPLAPPFEGIRTDHLLFVEFMSGEREMYDLDADPYEQVDVAKTADPRLVARAAAWVTTLRNCSGAGCRAAEVQPP